MELVSEKLSNMSIKLYQTKFTRIPEVRLSEWKKIPTAIIGDCLNRQNVMSSRINPILPGTMAGQAQTISVVAGDNGAIHAAMNFIEQSEIMVIDGGGYTERALWGGILNTRAIKHQIGGIVLDGAVRDIEELKEMNLPVYCVSRTPAGPHKGWGGVIGGSVSCGGVSVSRGDIVVGDQDGVVVIPLAQEQEVFEASLKRMDFENELIKKIELGEDLSEVFEHPQIEKL